MNPHTKLAISVVALVVATVSAGIPTAPKNFVNLGQVNGKFFFYDNNNATWYESYLKCKDAQMDMAEIANEEEQQFLGTKYLPGKFEKHYWTGGADVRTLQQFQWMGSKTNLNPSLKFIDPDGWNTCVLYWATDYDGDNSALYSRPCSVSTGVICQAK